MYDFNMTFLIRTLIVDDSDEFIKIARRYLGQAKQIELIDAAFTGEEAVQKAQTHQPDLILMDLILPDTNGVEVTRKIKALLPKTTIVMLSLYDLEEYRVEALRAGADELVNKSELSGAWVAALVEKMMAKTQKRNVLIVDDSPVIRRMIMSALRPLDVGTGEASNGLEAIEQLALNHYDAMTLDLNMPDMHGIEVLRFLRGSDRYRDLPVIVLTTRGDEDSQREAVLVGANSYLTKPFKPEELLKAVKGLLSL